MGSRRRMLAKELLAAVLFSGFCQISYGSPAPLDQLNIHLHLGDLDNDGTGGSDYSAAGTEGAGGAGHDYGNAGAGAAGHDYGNAGAGKGAGAHDYGAAGGAAKGDAGNDYNAAGGAGKDYSAAGGAGKDYNAAGGAAKGAGGHDYTGGAVGGAAGNGYSSATVNNVCKKVKCTGSRTQIMITCCDFGRR